MITAECLETYRQKDPNAVSVWEGSTNQAFYRAILDCTGELTAILYIDCGRQSNPDRGYCVMPFTHGLSDAIHDDTLEEALQKLAAFQYELRN